MDAVRGLSLNKTLPLDGRFSSRIKSQHPSQATGRQLQCEEEAWARQPKEESSSEEVCEVGAELLLSRC